MTFLEHEIDEFNAGIEGHDWFLLFAEKDAVLNHARTKKDPAKDASEIEKYCGNLDYLAASKLFGVNIAVHESRNALHNHPSWQIYNTFSTHGNAGLLSDPDPDKYSLFIHYVNKNHFQVILGMEM